MYILNLERALAIDGFMPEHELAQLAKWAAQYATVLEIGAYMGRSARAMADNSQGAIITVDDFAGLREIERNPPREDIRAMCQANLDDLIREGRVIILEMPHGSALHLFYAIGANVDMCFIDGSHDYKSVERDILGCLRLTPLLLCGHDYDEGHPDVVLAVEKHVPGFAVIPGTSLWYREYL